MKQTIAFAASLFNAPWRPYRWICTAVAFQLMFSISPGSANAQSKDQDNPIRLTSNVIAGVIGPGHYGDSDRYTFVAGPGEVTITLTVESGGYLNQVVCDLFDQDGKRIAGDSATTSGRRNEEAVEHVNVTDRQAVLLHIKLQHNFGPGKYRVQLSGAVNEWTPTEEALAAGRDSRDKPSSKGSAVNTAATPQWDPEKFFCDIAAYFDKGCNDTLTLEELSVGLGDWLRDSGLIRNAPGKPEDSVDFDDISRIVAAGGPGFGHTYVLLPVPVGSSKSPRPIRIPTTWWVLRDTIDGHNRKIVANNPSNPEAAAKLYDEVSTYANTIGIVIDPYHQGTNSEQFKAYLRDPKNYRRTPPK